MYILAGDIGGTKTLLQATQITAGTHHVLKEQRFSSHAFSHVIPMVHEFLADMPPIQAACFGVAGPINTSPQRQRAQVTNLPWHLDSNILSKALNIADILLINDFQAVGYGIEGLSEENDFAVIQPGNPQHHGVKAVLGAGTGLGSGYLVWQNDHYQVMSSEGGHTDFAPTDAEQIKLLQYLLTKYPHVSYERILSGSGLVNLYEFVRNQPQNVGKPSLLETEIASGIDAPAVISTYGLQQKDQLAQHALHLFVKIYGAKAGNLALSSLATGGLYIAGGIAPKIADTLKDGTFIHSFNDKGRMQALLGNIPVKIILNPKVGLIGAVMAASRL